MFFKSSTPKSAYPHRVLINLAGVFLKIILRPSYKVSKRLQLLGDLASYQIWLFDTFGKVKVRNSRERIWLDMHKSLDGREFIGVEFGVAWGYLTHFWFAHSSPTILEWHGFDTFTGLPRPWRNHPIGSFSAGGRTPDLKDQRIEWHIGSVEDTIHTLWIPPQRKQALVVFFDLDIYEPSLICWERIKRHLLPGDILYFDEAFDKDERQLLTSSIFPHGDFEFVSANWISLALRYVK